MITVFSKRENSIDYRAVGKIAVNQGLPQKRQIAFDASKQFIGSTYLTLAW